MSERIELDWSVDYFCRVLEWRHCRAFKAHALKQDKVDLGEHRETLEKLRSLRKLGKRVQIFRRRSATFQEWYDIIVDNKQVADAYIDNGPIFITKSHWNIWEPEFSEIF